MRADFSLGCRREDRFGELLTHLEAGRELDAADGARLAVVLPAAADQIAAGNAFDEDGLELHRNDGAAADERDFFRRNDGFGIDAGEVIRKHAVELLEPEVRNGGKNLALARNGIAEDDVEGGNSVARDNQKLVVADGERITHLARINLRQRGDVDLGKTSHGYISVERALTGIVN